VFPYSRHWRINYPTQNTLALLSSEARTSCDPGFISMLSQTAFSLPSKIKVQLTEKPFNIGSYSGGGYKINASAEHFVARLNKLIELAPLSKDEALSQDEREQRLNLSSH
jgi:hypothetical protein